MEGVTIKNLIFTFDSQMLRKAQHDKVGFFRQKAGCSTDVENSRQIGVYLKKQTQLSRIEFGVMRTVRKKMQNKANIKTEDRKLKAEDRI